MSRMNSAGDWVTEDVDESKTTEEYDQIVKAHIKAGYIVHFHGDDESPEDWRPLGRTKREKEQDRNLNAAQIMDQAEEGLHHE